MSQPPTQQAQPGPYPPPPPPPLPPPPYPVPQQRDPSLWYLDGNVVLVAQAVAFRVHCGVLARHSYVFSSWFSSPVLLGPEWLDGVPIVRLKPTDTAHDLRQALLAVYGLLSLYDPARLTFSIVAGLRRFALAYGMPALVDATRYLLSPTFPFDVLEWDEPSPRRLSFDLGPDQAIEAYNLAKMADDGHIFAAVYHCAQLPDDALRRGSRRADGTPETLTDADLQIILRAKARLKELGAKVLSMARAATHSRSTECARYRCRDVFAAGLLPGARDKEEVLNGHILSRWAYDDVDQMLSWGDTLCEACAAYAKRQHDEIRQTVWEDFMQSVDLPWWEKGDR